MQRIGVERTQPPASQYRKLPSGLQVRETRTGRQVLLTTLIAHRRIGKVEISKVDLAQLHASRLNVELDLRNIKATLSMEFLHRQTPDMNDKELWVRLLAYNLIRLLMAQAAHDAGVDPRSLNFKHISQLWIEWNCRGMSSTRWGDGGFPHRER